MKKIILGLSLLLLFSSYCLAADLFDKYSKKITWPIYWGNNILTLGINYELPIDSTLNGEVGLTYFQLSGANLAGGTTTKQITPVEFNLKVYSENKTAFIAAGLNYTFWTVKGNSSNPSVNLSYNPSGVGYQASIGILAFDHLILSLKYMMANGNGIVSGQNLSQSQELIILGVDWI